MKDLVIIQSCPSDTYFLWETHLWLESLRKIGRSDKALSLVYSNDDKPYNKQWDRLIELYPEAKFDFITDEDRIGYSLVGMYIPIIRPYSLLKYWKKNPDMENKVLFYCDNDVVFNERFNIDKYLEDDICYVSDTTSYLNSDYFDGKAKDVLPHRLEAFQKIDVLDGMSKLFNLTRETPVKNKMHTGGAQYILKDIDYTFWENVITGCIRVRQYLQNINRQYFESEDKGFQSWCADMVSVIYTLWNRNREVKIVPEMDFAWSSDPIEKLSKVGIFHNAGIVNEFQGDIPVFYKGKYHAGLNPLKDPYLDFLSTNEKNKTLCNSHYVECLQEIKQKYGQEY